MAQYQPIKWALLSSAAQHADRTWDFPVKKKSLRSEENVDTGKKKGQDMIHDPKPKTTKQEDEHDTNDNRDQELITGLRQ